MDHLLVPTPSPALAELSLAAAPDLPTAIAAGIAHGLAPHQALDSAFGKWLSEHADEVERFKLAHFYDGADASRAMQDQSRLIRFLCVALAEQQRQIAALAHLMPHEAGVVAGVPSLHEPAVVVQEGRGHLPRGSDREHLVVGPTPFPVERAADTRQGVTADVSHENPHRTPQATVPSNDHPGT